MTAALRRPTPHRPGRLRPADRRSLERGGWRTLLDFHENHVRTDDGRLVRVETVWVAEAERLDGRVVSGRGATADAAWAEVRRRVLVGEADPVPMRTVAQP